MTYRLIIAGSRTHRVDDEIITQKVHEFVSQVIAPREVSQLGSLDVWIKENLHIISGGAKGVDASAEEWSFTHLGRDATVYEADFRRFGNRAGTLRNETMGRKGDGALIFFHKVPSPGSSNMAAWMLLLGKPVRVYAVEKGKLITP